MYKNKKAVSEIISFVLLTLLIVVSSTVTIYFSQNMIDEKLSEIDYKNMESNFKQLHYKLEEIQNFHESSFSTIINFQKGQIKIKDNSISYISLEEFYGNQYCLNNICHINSNNYETIYFNLTNSYNFKQNLTLPPGQYILSFENYKNETKINIKIK